MKNIKSRKCLYENCITCPNYNYPNEKKPIFCAKHKKNDMIDILNK